jgi:hypothetical protein
MVGPVERWGTSLFFAVDVGGYFKLPNDDDDDDDDDWSNEAPSDRAWQRNWESFSEGLKHSIETAHCFWR